jgi:hypothetical protein
MTSKTQIIVEPNEPHDYAYDFVAYRQENEEDGPFGFGDTPEEAKDDLLKLESKQ